VAIAGKKTFTIYRKSPAALQNIFSSAYGLKKYFFERADELRNRLDELDRTQWLDIKALEQIQSGKLRELVQYAYQEIPFYRDLFDRHGLRPGQVQDLSDLNKIPILTKEQVKAHSNRLRAPRASGKKPFSQATSGTTGSPLRVFLDPSVIRAERAWIWRHRTWGGLDFRKGWRARGWRGTFGGHPIVPFERQKGPFWRVNVPGKQIHFSTYHMTKTHLPLYVKKMKTRKICFIDGYPSTIFILAKFLKSAGVPCPMKAVFTGAEPLYPDQRRVIEEVFGPRVFDYYGLTEKVASAGECQCHSGLHVNMEDTIVEIITREKGTSGSSEGEIVGTSLVNHTMPLLRYKTGDVSACRQGTCSCGRALMRIEPVQTKVEDIITTADGRYISASNLTYAFKPLSHIRESQIIQEDVDSITVKIVAQDDYSQEDERLLVKSLQEKLGSQMRIEIDRVDHIPRTQTGKFRFSISKVPFEL